MRPNRNHFILVAALLVSTFSSLAQKPKTPVEMNDYLASVTDSLYTFGTEWGRQVSASRQSMNFTLLAVPRLKMQHFIDMKGKEITGMKDIGGSEKLRAAMLEFLAYERRTITTSFLPFEKFDSTTTQAAIDKAIAGLQSLADSENAALKKVSVAQEEYAKKNGFTIEAEKKED